MACCVPLCPYKDLKISLFGVPKTSPLRDEWEKVLDVSFKTNSKVCRYHFKKEDVVDTWESGAGLSKYTICLKKPRLVKDAIPISLDLLFAVSNVHVQDDLNLTDISQKSNTSTSNSSESTGILITNIKNEHSYSVSGESQLNDDLFMLPSPKRLKMQKALDFQKLLSQIYLLKLPEKWYYDVSQTNTKIKVLCFHKLGPYRNDFTRAVEKQFVFTEGKGFKFP